jgi:hypothetical protein
MDISEINNGILNLLSTFQGAHPTLFRVLVCASVVTFLIALITDRREEARGSGVVVVNADSREAVSGRDFSFGGAVPSED